MNNIIDYWKEEFDKVSDTSLVTDTTAVTDRSAVLSAPASRRRRDRNQPARNGKGDYYSHIDGILLGNDGTDTEMRLVKAGDYNELYTGGNINELSSEVITINNAKIQADLQAVADRSSTPNADGEYQEHQIYLTLDRSTATISSMFGPAGTPNRTRIEADYSPATRVYIVGQPPLILIGQVHGHPPAPQGEITLRTMSDYDAETSADFNIPIYGIDAMDGPTRGRQAAIHRVTPDGRITHNVGRTSRGFDIGRDAMLIFGRRTLTRQ